MLVLTQEDHCLLKSHAYYMLAVSHHVQMLLAVALICGFLNAGTYRMFNEFCSFLFHLKICFKIKKKPL